MKKLVLLFSMIICGLTVSIAQTTATNFTVEDCDGNSYDLFTELDAGKVIVMAWVMPCGACIGPALTAYNIAESYEASNPGKIAYYLIDDYGNTNCNTLTGWGSTNGVGPNLVSFSNSEILMSDYGAAGMPKIVITGGASHSIYFNENNANAGDVDELENAMQTALSALTGISDPSNDNFNLNVSPNSSTSVISLDYTLVNAGKVEIDVFNILGQKVERFISEYQQAGTHKMDLNMKTAGNGIYFLKFRYDQQVRIVKFSVSG